MIHDDCCLFPNGFEAVDEVGLEHGCHGSVHFHYQGHGLDWFDLRWLWCWRRVFEHLTWKGFFKFVCVKVD
jgi:hypothetical protein